MKLFKNHGDEMTSRRESENVMEDIRITYLI